MEKNSKLSNWAHGPEDDVQIVCDINDFNLCKGKKDFFPFISYDGKQRKQNDAFFHLKHKWGLLNKNGEIVVEPQYDWISSEYIPGTNFIKVSQSYANSYNRKNRNPQMYFYTAYGLINSHGDVILPCEYGMIDIWQRDKCIFITRKPGIGRGDDGTVSIVDYEGKTIIPFGLYCYIEPFYKGLARCRRRIHYKRENGTTGSRLVSGIINTRGEIVVEPGKREIPVFSTGGQWALFKICKILKEENPSVYYNLFGNVI